MVVSVNRPYRLHGADDGNWWGCCRRVPGVWQGPSAYVWAMCTNDGADDGAHARSMTLKSHHVWLGPDKRTKRKNHNSDGGAGAVAPTALC